MVRLSLTKKLGGIPSWGLPAFSACPDAKDADGQVADVCKLCYARQGRYRFKNVSSRRQQNMKDFLRPEWVDEMVTALNPYAYMRWFDSGDFVSTQLAEKVYQVCLRTPWCKHWIPTRAYKRDWVRSTLEQLKQLPNVSVRYSSDSIHGEYESFHGSTVIPTHEWDDPNVHVCPAYRQAGRCMMCRACWDKKTAVVAYVAHGQKAKLIYRSAA